MNVIFLLRKARYYLCLSLFFTLHTYADDDDWVQEEIQWWEKQQESFQQDFNQIPEEPKLKNNSEFKLTEKYWKSIKSYFFKNDTYTGYCVLDAYDTKLPLIITKVRNKNSYSIAVDVNIYVDNIEDTSDLKICHTDDLFSVYAWTDTQSVRYTFSNHIYEIYFKLCPLNQYPNTNIPGILIPLETVANKKNLTNELNKQLKDGMESIWKSENDEFSQDTANKKTDTEISQSPTTEEIKSWQTWFKATLSALKEVNFDFKKQVIDPICLDKDLKLIFEKHFGRIKTNEDLEAQFKQLSEAMKQMKEESRQRILKKAQENMESTKRAEAERAKGIQQFGSTTSNIAKEMNQLFTRSNENEEFDPKAALKRINDKDIPKEEPKKVQPQNEPGKLKLDNRFKQNIESIFGDLNNSESNPKPQKENLNVPGKIKIDPAFAEKLKNDLGVERREQEVTTSTFARPSAPDLNLNENSTPNTSVPTPPPLNLNSTKTEQSTQQEFYIPPAPELKLNTSSAKIKEMNKRQHSLEEVMKKRQEMFNKR